MTTTTGPKVDRIARDRRIQAACALDTLPLLAERVRGLLSWGRRISVARRYLDGGETELKVGLTVDTEQGDRAIHLGGSAEKGWHFGVHLAPGINGFGFSAYPYEAPSEAEVWRRYRAGERRDITIVELAGSSANDSGPSHDEYLRIEDWNQHGVGQAWVIGFDTNAYYGAWKIRHDRGYEAGGGNAAPLATAYCREWVLEGSYRMQCGYPVVEGTCMAIGDHVEVKG